MRAFRKYLTILCCLLTLLSMAASAEGSLNMNHDGFSTSYTYGYDYWQDVIESPDAYRVLTVIDSLNLGLDEILEGIRMNRPQSLYVRNSSLYIVDTNNNRILQVECEKERYTLTRVIKEIQGCEISTFNHPYDVFVDADENIYVADTDNFRVVMVDKDLNYIKEFIKPTDTNFDQNLDFKPRKIVVDVAGRVYALVANINKGLVKYEADGTFSSFIGANQVTVSTFDYIWKMYFQTQAQRDASVAFVPTEYENIYIDKEGFIYATTTTFSEYDLLWDNAKPIRRINSIGNDILIKNDRYPPIGDLNWLEGDSTYFGPSKMTDITVLDNDIYIALDRVRGRMFGYDDQGVMLWAFGTRGNIEGAFNSPIALEHMGYDLFVLDQNDSRVTVFTPTEYGSNVYAAINEYKDGRYEASADIWRKVLKQNSNYSLAFRGIGRSYLKQNQYEDAMEYFKMAHDQENYGRAFKLYRKDWIEKNIKWIFLVLIVLIVLWLIKQLRRKMQWEVIMHERNEVRKTNG